MTSATEDCRVLVLIVVLLRWPPSGGRPFANVVLLGIVLWNLLAKASKKRAQGVLQETLRPAGLERSISRAVDQIAEALPLTALLFAHGRQLKHVQVLLQLGERARRRQHHVHRWFREAIAVTIRGGRRRAGPVRTRLKQRAP